MVAEFEIDATSPKARNLQPGNYAVYFLHSVMRECGSSFFDAGGKSVRVRVPFNNLLFRHRERLSHGLCPARTP